MIGGIPGGMELAIILVFVIPIVVAYWVYKDVTKRNTTHPFAWPIMTLLSFLPYMLAVIPWFVFYFVVRDEIGSGHNE